MSRNLLTPLDDEKLKSQIGDRLVEVRNRMDKTQSEMADELGVAFRSLQDNERGKSIPGGKVLAEYVRLGVDANWILTGDGFPLLGQTPGKADQRSALDFIDSKTKQISAIDIPVLDGAVNRSSYVPTPSEKLERTAIIASREIARRYLPMSRLQKGERDIVAVPAGPYKGSRQRTLVFIDPHEQSAIRSGCYLVDTGDGLDPKSIVNHRGHFVISRLDSNKIETVRNKRELNNLKIVGRIVSILSPPEYQKPDIDPNDEEALVREYGEKRAAGRLRRDRTGKPWSKKK